MNLPIIFRILGALLMLFSLSHLPPLVVSWHYNDGEAFSFLAAFTITLISGFVCWAPVMNNRRELRTRDGFLVVVLFWSVLGSFGSIPFLFADSLGMSVTDAFFESISGLTTTGSTVLSGLDQLPRSILYYRQQLQWIGGMGIIAIAVAILPMLGIGGMQLYRAESPGTVKDTSLLPRVAETARALLLIYAGLTIVCAGLYFLAGMGLFDAIGHSFATISIGGFSTHDTSLGYFDSPYIEMIATVFMFLSGVNFALHFFAWHHKSYKHYFRDPEFQFYLSLMVSVILITVLYLAVARTYPLQEAIAKGIFEVVSIATTTGFSSADFSIWPSALYFLLFYTAFVGSCAGSTGGGLKIVRVILIIKQGIREIEKLIHANAVVPIKLGNERIPDRVLESVWGFFSVYVIAYLLMFFVLLETGLDITTAFTAVGANINNLGPGMGEVAHGYGNIPDSAKWTLCLGMILGRLEVFSLLVVLSPSFWRP